MLSCRTTPGLGLAGVLLWLVVLLQGVLGWPTALPQVSWFNLSVSGHLPVATDLGAGGPQQHLELLTVQLQVLALEFRSEPRLTSGPASGVGGGSLSLRSLPDPSLPLLGLTRLVCEGGRLLESHPDPTEFGWHWSADLQRLEPSAATTGRSTWHAGLPSAWLVPFAPGSADAHDPASDPVFEGLGRRALARHPYAELHSLITTGLRSMELRDTDLRRLLLLALPISVQPLGARYDAQLARLAGSGMPQPARLSFPNLPPAAHNFPADWLSRCRLRILPPEHQTWMPSRRLSFSGEAEGSPPTDPWELPLASLLRPATVVPANSGPVTCQETPPESGGGVLGRLAETALQRILEDAAVVQVRQSPPPPPPPPLPPLPEEEPPGFLELGVHTRAAVKGLGQMFGGLVKPFVSPVGDVMGGIVGGTVAGVVADPIASQLAATLPELVINEVLGRVAPQVAQGIVRPTVDAFKQQFTATLTQLLQEYVTTFTKPLTLEQVGERLRLGDLTPTVAGTISAAEAAKLAVDVSEVLIGDTTEQVCRALPAEVVRQTGASWANDFYCYTCETYAQQCEFCSRDGAGAGGVVELQAQMAQHYADHFAPWYTQFYADWHRARSPAKIVRRRPTDLDGL